ncbi:MAG TPA: tetratricopeptide repeat protein [Acidobacteriaceae bacterium]|jgi:tetratricopeptide (TPR) repeat protein
MSIRSKRRSTSLALLLTSAAALWAQTVPPAASGKGDLRQDYEHAVQLQQAGKLNEAAQQYHLFLYQALDGLASQYGHASDLPHAAALYDEVLALEPQSDPMILRYAQTALVMGDFQRAEALATKCIGMNPTDHEARALAHQVRGRALLRLNRDAEARKEFEIAVQLDPVFPNGYDLAVACLDLNDETCAVKVFDEMLKSYGDTPEIHMAFGRAYSDSDFQPRAITEFRRAIQENPKLPHAHYLLAAILLATGNAESPLEAAEAELKQELDISPNDAMTYAALGKLDVTRNRNEEAETFLKKSVELNPNSPDAYLYLGQLYVNMNRSAEAETALRQCIRVTTDVSRNRYQVQRAHYLLGRILMKNGHPEEAHAEMLLDRELADKTLAQDKSKLAGLMESSGSQDAQAASQTDVGATPKADAAAVRQVEALREQLKPAIADSYNNLGAIAATSGNYAGAVIYFKQAGRWDPSLEGLDFNLGRAAFAGSQYADAVPPLSRYVKAHPDDTGARSVLGISQSMTESYRDAVETLRPVVAKAGIEPLVEYAYDDSLIKSGQVKAGMERLTVLETAHPEIAEVHQALGEEFVVQGNTAGAIAEFEKAVQRSPGNEKLHRELADSYNKAHRPADAKRETEAADALGKK